MSTVARTGAGGGGVVHDSSSDIETGVFVMRPVHLDGPFSASKANVNGPFISSFVFE